MRVVAIRHVAFEDLGLLAPLLQQHGATIDYVDAWNLDQHQVEQADLVIFLGGPISVNDEQDYPFLRDEIALARRRIAENRPILGICLGAQIMTRAMGGVVRPGSQKEIGWAPIELTDAGQASVLAPLDGVPVLHWHGEVCEPPPGIASLARTPACAVQAFSVGTHALALQFHLEAGPGGIEAWLVGHTVEISSTPGVSINGLRADTARYSAELAPVAAAVFANWLSLLEGAT